ncbi:MAG: acyl-CoA thioesterase [Calditrichaeota bacterium]|nr:MAG: acyl-CoA thioesterase [Calditrichota bacterium]
MTEQGKPVSASKVEMTEIVLPNDANTLGNVLGGKVMHMIDIACAIAASRHCRRPVVTASMDHLDFLHPIKVGELIIIKASVNRVFRTSMEVGAKVWSENLLTGEVRHTSSAYLTFVALDENNCPVEVPQVIPETEEEKRRWEEAAIRRENRLKERRQLQERQSQ